MSAEYQGQNPIDIAKKAEADLNTLQAKGNTTAQKAGVSDSSAFSFCQPKHASFLTFQTALESGVDESVRGKFPGADVQVGGQGASDNRTIPLEEGGDITATGK